MTLAGGTFEFESRAIVVLAGADFEASIPLWTAVWVRPGEQVRCGRSRAGARAYLCVNGGIAVPPVLGSSSTHLLTGIGGFEGRALRRGDVLPVGPPRRASTHRRRAAIRPVNDRGVIHVTAPRDTSGLCSGEWEVQPDSDRMGIRLRGPGLPEQTGQMITEGVPLGAIQSPPDGQPIILFVEHQTTGGYHKIANIISADFSAAGQLRPGDQVQFEQVSIDAALDLLAAQERWLASLV